jgi:hypothetical protein
LILATERRYLEGGRRRGLRFNIGDEMNRLGRIALLVAGVALVGSPSLAAQSQEREGVYASLGLGYGTADVDCNECGDTSREGALTGYFELGLSVSEMFLLSAMGNGWYKSIDDTKIIIGTIGLAARFYPVNDAGFFIKGGLGSSYIDVEFTNSSKESGFTLGWLLGGGYDVPLANTTALTFILAVYGGNWGDLGSLTGVTTNVVSATVGFSAF